MLDGIKQLSAKVADLYGDQVLIWIGLGLLFAILSLFKAQSCNPGSTWWNNPGLKTDIIYKVVDKVIGPYLQLPPVLIAYGLLCGITSSDQALDYVNKGIGPLSALPFWGQVAAYLVLGDFLLYWSHRIMHSHALWRFHAAHHSATQVDWTTTYRFHPINHILGAYLIFTILITIGISPAVITFMVPWEILTGAYVHANLNWTHGPFKYFLASPVFHRWHHGPSNEGGSSNFAPTLPVWDLMFGTFYMPDGKLPQTFGVDDPDYPDTYIGQLIYPFIAKPTASAEPASR